MRNRMKILCLGLFISFAGYADETSTPLSVAIVASDNSGVQISTTKDSLHGDGILICSATKKSCSVYQCDDFSSAKSNDTVEDVATGEKIYTYSLIDYRNYKLLTEITLAFIFKGSSIGAKDVKFDGHRSFIINNNKIKHIISYCTSSDGVHVLSKFENIHLYYSLGYEVEANCPDEVYK
jgi:hypothetical protein